ncbi:unnamed protein product, partial [Adineta ricciae]
DPELERKIDCEVKMIDGISKLLNVVTSLEQTIECHKALILSQQRMLAFMCEIQRKQQNLLEQDTDDLKPTKATIVLSDIRLPLAWTKMKAKSAIQEQKTFAVFCLARVGYEIIDTGMKFIDRRSSDILFTDKLIFNNVPHDFELHLEIYALNKRLALSSSVKDFVNRYSYFSTHGSPKVTRKLLETGNQSFEQSQSKFVRIAHAILTKESVSKSAKPRYLTMDIPQENPLMQLPITETYVALFFAQPLCYIRLATYTGKVRVYNIPYSCVLAAGFLNGEEIMRDDYSDQHRFSIAITPETLILARTEQLSFSIYNRGFDVEEFFVDDIFMLNNWTRALQQHVIDVAAWQITFDHLPSMRRGSYQFIASSPTSSISSRAIRKRPTLRSKTKSLNDIHQVDNASQSVRTDALNRANSIVDRSRNFSNTDDDSAILRTCL